ncbi:ABC transporter permease [Niallia sp. 01092]|uniref:ABC transporter permease n=1 Tax=unclassified Niallia TaxID=2837522 RepID=UPI003FD30D11
MARYVMKRILQMIPTLFGVSVLIFFLFALVPGDFVDSNQNITAERAQELRALYGLDKPIIERYFIWVGQMLQGDFGFSLKYQQNVTDVLGDYIWNSFLIAFTSLVLTWIIALLVGVVSATKQYSWFDGIVTFFVFAAMSFPSFFIGLLLIKFLAVDLHLFPVAGMIETGSATSGFSYVVDVAKHMVLPVTVLTMLSVGSLTRYFRTNMLEVIRQDFIRTARAKGLKEKTVVYKHALRNALLPAITLLAFELPGLFSGAIITEQIFNWPGAGHIHLEALGERDYPVLMGFTMFLALLTIVGNLVADLLYGWADPRVRMK